MPVRFPKRKPLHGDRVRYRRAPGHAGAYSLVSEKGLSVESRRTSIHPLYHADAFLISSRISGPRSLVRRACIVPLGAQKQPSQTSTHPRRVHARLALRSATPQLWQMPSLSLCMGWLVVQRGWLRAAVALFVVRERRPFWYHENLTSAATITTDAQLAVMHNVLPIGPPSRRRSPGVSGYVPSSGQARAKRNGRVAFGLQRRSWVGASGDS